MGIRFGCTAVVFISALASAVSGAQVSGPRASQAFQSSDLHRLRAVGDVVLAPDDRHIAYTVEMFDRPGRPYSQVWILDLDTGSAKRLGGEREATSGPEWSPDGKWLAYSGGEEGKSGLMIAHADGSGPALLASTAASNS